ncbi:uncharacterized protein CLUP02_17347 [Colletotrichum lupini]|uniref:Uncharacterized protein n=1 Tax=Colletotrichum lupini TaxID=145971 RepID=A0A9Q8SEZ4_9PEZI|nr:uncharacterized protein CLUP02_17347 [Colletotrichum lupini]UQC75838.1 hypothetical protein CLUP02_17347 [Colletotrichum lupini]
MHHARYPNSNGLHYILEIGMRRNYTLHSSRRRVNSIIDDNISLHAPVRSTNLARAESTRWLSLEPSQDLKGSRSSGTGRWNATASASSSAPSVCYTHREDESLAARWKPSASANVQVAVNNMAPSSHSSRVLFKMAAQGTGIRGEAQCWGATAPIQRTLICCFDHTFRVCFYDSMLPVGDEVEGCYYALGINSELGEKRNTHHDARRVHSSCWTDPGQCQLCILSRTTGTRPWYRSPLNVVTARLPSRVFKVYENMRRPLAAFGPTLGARHVCSLVSYRVSSPSRNTTSIIAQNVLHVEQAQETPHRTAENTGERKEYRSPAEEMTGTGGYSVMGEGSVNFVFAGDTPRGHSCPYRREAMLQAADVDSWGFATAHKFVWTSRASRVRVARRITLRVRAALLVPKENNPLSWCPLPLPTPLPPVTLPYHIAYCVLCREERVRETVDGERPRKIGTSLTFASTLPATTSFVWCLELFPPSASPSQVAASGNLYISFRLGFGQSPCLPTTITTNLSSLTVNQHLKTLLHDEHRTPFD